MTYFYLASTVWQTVLLVISQFTVISLAAGIGLLYKRKSSLPKIAGISAVLLMNVILYVLMQLESHITDAAQELYLPIPCAVPLLVSLLSAGVGAWAVLGETKNRKMINHSSIHEAFDNLPAGVCFFNEAGLPVFCNLTMQRFSFAVCGRDVQFITDLEECFAAGFVPVSGTRKDGNVFILPDASAWHLEKRIFLYEGGNEYTQYIAKDVTDLHENRVALQKENENLRRTQVQLQRLSANIMTITREEEILNTKMRVHDEMGRCLIAAQKYLKDDCAENVPDSVATAWQRAISMLKYNNDTTQEDMLLQIRKTCAYMKIDYVQTGSLPNQESIAYLLTCAVRECVTNAVRYAEATALYTTFSETAEEASVIVTNNGKTPEREIVEGGGLSTLRHRVERAGGVMSVQSFPNFQLTVILPKGKDGVL